MTALPILLCLLVLGGVDQPVTPLAEATRGITGTVSIEIRGGTLRGSPDLDLDSPLLVRVAAVHPGPDDRISYDLEFIGTDPGQFDLRDVLIFADGSSIDQLDPIPVVIMSHLANDAASDLSMTVPPASRLRGGYLWLLAAIGLAWIAIPIILAARRLLRPREIELAAPPKPTLAEQLAPLVQAAANRSLTVPEQARLELLLYWYWQEDLGLEEARPEAVSRLRRHAVAGQLLRTVEAWLHDPGSTGPTNDEINTLLEPYRQLPPGALA